MFRLIPLLAVGVILGGAALLREYENIMEREDLEKLDYEKELKRLQKELSRLYHLKDTNVKLQETSDIEEIELSVNGVEINLRIKELTERMNLVIKLRNKENENAKNR